jgi:hypothetical protein
VRNSSRLSIDVCSNFLEHIRRDIDIAKKEAGMGRSFFYA